MGSWGDGARHHGATIVVATWTVLVAASASGALGLGMQGQWIPGGRSLTPRPRRLWPHDYIAAADQPLLRRKRPRLVAGGFSLVRG